MAQNSWDIPLGADFIDTKAAVDGALGNLVTNHSGTSAPSTIKDRMWWVDTTNSKVKMENGAGGWLTMFSLAEDGGLLPKAGGVMTGNIDLNGVGQLILDADGDTKIASTTEDQIDFSVNGAIDMALTANLLDLKSTKLKDPNYNTTASVGSLIGQIIVNVNGTDRALAYYAVA